MIYRNDTANWILHYVLITVHGNDTLDFVPISHYCNYLQFFCNYQISSTDFFANKYVWKKQQILTLQLSFFPDITPAHNIRAVIRPYVE